GLLSSKAPFGPSMSFLIASPLLNPVIVILLWTLLGWKLTLYYVVIVGIFAVLIGVVWKALGLEHSVKNVNVRKASSQDDNIKKSKWKLALEDAWGFFYLLLPYLLIGVLYVIFIYDLSHQESFFKYEGGVNSCAIPFASMVGNPMYILAAAIWPFGVALVING